MVYNYSTMANLQMSKNNTESGVHYLQKSIDLYRKLRDENSIDDPVHYSSMLNNMGVHLNHKKD